MKEVEIGKNLSLKHFLLQNLTDQYLEVIDGSHETHQIPITQIDELEIVGIKSGSGFSGSMDWGMRNPTLLLPTHFVYNIIDLFKRKNDSVHVRVQTKDGMECIVVSKRKQFDTLKKYLSKHR